METNNATKKAAPKFCIILAYTEVESVFVRERATDLGERPIMRDVTIAKAATWVLKGSDADLAKAQAYAAKVGSTVFCYPTSERDPLGRAKAEILKGAK